MKIIIIQIHKQTRSKLFQRYPITKKKFLLANIQIIELLKDYKIFSKIPIKACKLVKHYKKVPLIKFHNLIPLKITHFIDKISPKKCKEEKLPKSHNKEAEINKKNLLNKIILLINFNNHLPLHHYQNKKNKKTNLHSIDTYIKINKIQFFYLQIFFLFFQFFNLLFILNLNNYFILITKFLKTIIFYFYLVFFNINNFSNYYTINNFIHKLNFYSFF